jgi:uncharacterized membrane protein
MRRGNRNGFRRLSRAMKQLWPILILALCACSQPAQQSGPQGSDPRDEPATAPISAPYAQPSGNKANASQPAAPKESACRVQDNAVLSNGPLKVVGTEPFWGARIDGRCVTYSTPENQGGTRIWTRYTAGSDGGSWVGAYQGKPFELKTHNVESCSDGMSDTVYPIEAVLKVSGEDLRGCAQPL